MAQRITTQGLAQKGFVRASQIPYLLLALALLALLFFWSNIRSKDSQIAELQRSKATEIANLEAKIQTDSTAMSELNSTHLALEADHKTLKTETMPALKRELSFAKANSQRAEHVSNARDNLQASLQTATDSNQQLKTQLQVLPGLKRDLSFANAANQRSKHSTAARENLMADLKLTKTENMDLARQLQQAVDMNGGSSSAEGQQAIEMPENSMAEIQQLKELNEHYVERLADRIVVIADLKRELSFANADNQRAVHAQTARNNLVGQLQETELEKAALLSKVNQMPELKKRLSLSNAENARLRHVSQARDRLIEQGRMQVSQSN